MVMKHSAWTNNASGIMSLNLPGGSALQRGVGSVCCARHHFYFYLVIVGLRVMDNISPVVVISSLLRYFIRCHAIAGPVCTVDRPDHDIVWSLRPTRFNPELTRKAPGCPDAVGGFSTWSFLERVAADGSSPGVWRSTIDGQADPDRLWSDHADHAVMCGIRRTGYCLTIQETTSASPAAPSTESNWYYSPPRCSARARQVRESAEKIPFDLLR